MKIFLTVGTHPQKFDRLIKAMDEITKKKKNLVVFGQIGSSLYKPKFFGFKELIAEPEYSKKFQESDLIVSHGGAGAIIHAMDARKKLIIVPRLKKFNEHTNDHQLELAELLEKHKKAIAVVELLEMEQALKKIQKFSPDFDSTRSKLISGLEEWIEKNF